jgi:hypothetical protein
MEAFIFSWLFAKLSWPFIFWVRAVKIASIAVWFGSPGVCAPSLPVSVVAVSVGSLSRLTLELA